MTGFEGSYLGVVGKISPAAIMECKICWHVYDPGLGDDTRQVTPGTPFFALPDDWTCPGCGAPAAQFLVQSDPGAETALTAAEMARRTAALVADFTEIFNARMRDVPLVNHALSVEAVGFAPYAGGFLGVLVAPWFMNLIILPGPDRALRGPGEKEIVAFPSGAYEFLHNRRDLTGPYLACSLFSPMGQFSSQLQAVDVARAVMAELFRPENRAETDRAGEIRAQRLAALTPEPVVPTRRQIMTGGLAG